jgi:hypothetical protein
MIDHQPKEGVPTMNNTATKTYRVAVIERALAYYDVEAENPRAAAENWSDGEFRDRDDEALDSEGPTIVRERQADGTWRRVPNCEWEDETPVADTVVPQLLAACRMVTERWERGDLAEAARACSAAIAAAEAAAMVPNPGDPAKKPYSVLLLYPDCVNDSGTETYYHFVNAPDPYAAIAAAQHQALTANEWDDMNPGRFTPLLVTEGHHYGQPLV